MKVAHAGIAPAPLPGLAAGSRFDAAPPPAAAAPAVSANGAGQQNNQQNGGSGLDFWLLDKLFGRR
jgi:hypothetical protein